MFRAKESSVLDRSIWDPFCGSGYHSLRLPEAHLQREKRPGKGAETLRASTFKLT